MPDDPDSPSTRPLVVRLNAAMAVLDQDPARALALMLDVYDDCLGTFDHDVADAVELAVQAHAGDWLLALIAARRERPRSAAHQRRLGELAQCVQDEIARRGTG